MDVEGLVRPVVEAQGLEFVDVGFGTDHGRRVLRVTIDKEGGVDLDTIASASEAISRRLDLEGFDAGGRYVLEVSSPGLERALKDPGQFARAVGERVKIKTTDEVHGARVHLGVLTAAGDDAVTIDTDAGERRIAYGLIGSARTVFEWGDHR
jgi:ribosome maturation factor RimP